MARTKLHKQLSQAEIERFLVEAERLHKSIVQPLLSPTSEHYRALRAAHEALLKSIVQITGKDAPFIRWNGTGPVKRALCEIQSRLPKRLREALARQQLARAVYCQVLT